MVQPQILNVIEENGLKLEKRALVMGYDAITFSKFPYTYGIPIRVKMSRTKCMQTTEKRILVYYIHRLRAVNLSYLLTARFEQTNMNHAKTSHASNLSPYAT